MNQQSTFQPSSSADNKLKNASMDWLDDASMISEVQKLSSELKSRSVICDEDESSLCETNVPRVKSDYHKEIKDGIKEVEIDGKKYFQKYQRHIVLEKHTVKQIVTFSGDEASILDFEVEPQLSVNSPKLENEVFFNFNSENNLEDMKKLSSPKIVIRSANHAPNKPDERENHPLKDTNSERNEINSFINKFGQSDFTELSINKKTSKDLRNSFISQWQKTETQSGPQSKIKTLSCVERFINLSKQGKVLHQSTCVQMTRSLIVRSKSSDNEIKSNYQEHASPPDVAEIPLLFKISVTDDLVYNDKYNAITAASGKQLSIAAGQIDALVAHACSIAINTTSDYHLFHKAFVITYPLFVTTEEVLNKLLQRYTFFHANMPNTNRLVENTIHSSGDIQRELLSAIINLMVQIINHWSRPIDGKVQTILSSFCDTLNKFGAIKHSLLIESALREVSNRMVVKNNRKSHSLAAIVDDAKNIKDSTKTILDFDSNTIAEQLTLLESEIFDQIELEDLLNFKAASNNPLLMKCVHFFNKLTFWIKTQLLFTENEKTCNDREKRFNKFLEILKVLKSHQNFSGYTSILYSLIDFPEKVLSKKTRMKFAEESQFMNLSNKKLYLNAIQSAQYPFIPLLAETFSHLTRLNEIMPTFISNPSSNVKSVNFKKMWQYFIIIQYFVVKMHLPPEKKHYQFKPDVDVLVFINNFKDSLSETQIFEYKEKLIRSKSKKLYQKDGIFCTDL